MAQTDIVHDDAALRIGVTRNFVAFAWLAAPDAAHVKSLSRAVQVVASRHSNRFAAMSIVVSGTPLFSDEMRAEMVKFLKDPKLQGLGNAHVVDVAGLAGTAVRTFLSTVLLVARPGAPHKVFAKLPEGASWLAPLLSKDSKDGQSWSPADILAAAAAVTAPRPPR
jgi:hypothetical protein